MAPSGSPATTAEPSPLDERQLSLVAHARAARRKLRLAALIALCNVVGLAACACLSVGFGLLELNLSPIGLALAVLAWNEARGRSQLLVADVQAPRRLALNQLFLLAAVLVYCAYGAYAAWTGPGLLDSVLLSNPELPELLGEAASGTGTSVDELSEWGRTAALFFYGAAAMGSAVVQGLTALYYWSLRPVVAELAAAPAWARALA